MNFADVAAASTFQLGALACVALSCLFLTSTVILVIVLKRRGRRDSTGA